MADVRLIHGDNAEVMRALHDAGERFTLAYLDPPFFTGRDFETATGEHAYSDKWGSVDEYLAALMQRAELAFNLLADSGCIVIHVDPTVSHYVKVWCDSKFGHKNFASEIVWRYRRWPAQCRNFQAMHDVLLRYVTGRAEPTFNQLYEPLSASTLDRSDGKQMRKVSAAGNKRTSFTGEKSPGSPLSDVWEISIVAPSGDERTGYPTQKPEALIARIVDALTNEGDAVLDPFCGSGTVPAVCARRGRRCVSIDQSPVAIRYASERLAPILAQPSLFGGARA